MTNTLKGSSAPKRLKAAEFDPEYTQYTISQAQNLCVAIKDYLEDVSGQVVIWKEDPTDEVARAIIANTAIGRVEVWQTLLSQITDQLIDANDNLQIAVDAEYRKGGAQ